MLLPSRDEGTNSFSSKIDFMKHTFLTSVVLLIVATTTGSAQNRYAITGYLTNQANAEIKLSYRESGRPVTASVYATNGSFTLSGPAPSRPVVATLNTGVDRNIHLGLSKRSMFVAPPPLTFSSERCMVTATALLGS